MKAEHIVAAYNSRKQERSGIEGVWQLIERFIMPFAGQFFTDTKAEAKIDWHKREIYDSTGINANQLLASNIQSSITNPISKWANYSFDRAVLRDSQEAMEWLQECEYAVMNSIRATNFNNEAGEFYLDLTGFAVGVQAQEEEEFATGDLKDIIFDTIPPEECCFDLELDGRIRNFYRNLNWTTIQIVDKFGLENVPEKIAQEYTNPVKNNYRHRVIFSVYKRPENQEVNTYSIIAPDKRPYGAKYVLVEDTFQLGSEIGYYEMPIVMAQWRTVSGSSWGFSPAMIAIWDVLSLNQMTELILKAGEKVLDPAILTTNRGIFGDIDLSAGGVTVVSDTKNLVPFESRARFDVSQLNKEDLKQSIRDAFYWDHLQLKNSPAMTAYEVQARIQLMQRLIGPTYGRLHTHYLDPMLERHFKILYRYQRLPKIPDIVLEYGGEILINYTGPLANAQRMEEVQNMEGVLGDISNVAQTFEEAKDIIDIDASIRELVSAKGAPAKMLRTTAEVNTLRKDRAQAQAQAQVLAQAQEAGNAMQSIGMGQEALQNDGE